MPTYQPDDITGVFTAPETLSHNALTMSYGGGGSGNSGSIAAGGSVNAIFTQPIGGLLRSTPVPSFAVYVDNDNNAAYLYPDGSAISASNRPLVQWAPDLRTTQISPAPSNYVWKMRIKNEDSGAHTYYVHDKVFMPFRNL